MLLDQLIGGPVSGEDQVSTEDICRVLNRLNGSKWRASLSSEPAPSAMFIAGLDASARPADDDFFSPLEAHMLVGRARAALSAALPGTTVTLLVQTNGGQWIIEDGLTRERSQRVF